ncbi:hypothetical protein BJV74DRAFT_802103 [Russula compacta]|nr:hypothetical protein BJV74DRAFT_802103 [Russula compacta]
MARTRGVVVVVALADPFLKVASRPINRGKRSFSPPRACLVCRYHDPINGMSCLENSFRWNRARRHTLGGNSWRR